MAHQRAGKRPRDEASADLSAGTVNSAPASAPRPYGATQGRQTSADMSPDGTVGRLVGSRAHSAFGGVRRAP